VDTIVQLEKLVKINAMIIALLKERVDELTGNSNPTSSWVSSVLGSPGGG